MKSRVGKEEERDKRNFRLGNKAGCAGISTILIPSINCHWQVNSYLIDCWVPSLVTNVKSLASNLHAYTCRRRKRGHANLLVFVATSLYTNWQETQAKLNHCMFEMWMPHIRETLLFHFANKGKFQKRHWFWKPSASIGWAFGFVDGSISIRKHLCPLVCFSHSEKIEESVLWFGMSLASQRTACKLWDLPGTPC